MSLVASILQKIIKAMLEKTLFFTEKKQIRRNGLYFIVFAKTVWFG